MPYKKSIYKRIFLLFFTIVTIYTGIFVVTLVIKQQQIILQNSEYLNEFYVVHTANNIDYKVNIALQTAQAIAHKGSVANYLNDSSSGYKVMMDIYDDIRSSLNPIRSLNFEIGLTRDGRDFISSDGFFDGGGYLEFIGLDKEYFDNLNNLFMNDSNHIYMVPEELTTLDGNNTIVYRFKEQQPEADLYVFITFHKNKLISSRLPNNIGTFNVWSSDTKSSFASLSDERQTVFDIAQINFKAEMADHRVWRGESKNFVAYRVNSDALPSLEYIYSVQKEELKQFDFEQLQVVVFLLIVLVLGGGVIIYLATKQSYSPIQEMLNKIPEGSRTTTDAENELEFIIGTIRRTNEDNVRLLDKQKYNYSLEAERGLFQSVSDGDSENMHIILAEVLSSNLKVLSLDEYSISCFKYALLSTVKRILRSHNQSVLNFVEQNQEAFQNLTVNDPDKLCSAFEDIFDSLVYNCADIDAMEYSPTTTKILNYIHEHYQEDLSLTIISEHFGLTEGYVSKLLKETADIRFKNYLNHLKIKKAKELLQTGNYKISEVSSMVGYNNVNSFIRAFKKQDGISPGNYKKIDD